MWTRSGTHTHALFLVPESLVFGGFSVSVQGFTSKERDSETGLDYFGARYMSSAQGRFTSPDPLDANLLRVLNPQRWNKYAYVVNNPLAFTDPDGLDAIAVKFGNGAHGLGHAGVVSIHHDGKGTFADFSPQHQGRAHDAGMYTFNDFKSTLVYGSDGKPTKASLTALANELADAEQQPRDSVSLAYFKTSDAETASLDAYINAARAQQSQGKQPAYWVGFRDCIAFCQNGLAKAGVPGSAPGIFDIPNLQYLRFWLLADQTATGTNPPKPKEEVTSKVCYADGTCQ
jgi:RHS repeat-associated protein